MSLHSPEVATLFVAEHAVLLSSVRRFRAFVRSLFSSSPLSCVAQYTSETASTVDLSPVYTIQPVVKPVIKPVVVSSIQTFNRLSNPLDNRFDNRLYRVYCQLSNRLYNLFDNRLNEHLAVCSTRLNEQWLFVQHGCETGCETGLTTGLTTG